MPFTRSPCSSARAWNRAAAFAAPAASRRRWTMDPRKVSELRAFVKMCKQDPSVLHTEEMRFLREWVER